MVSPYVPAKVRTLGRQIRSRRMEAGRSVEWLAKQVGMSKSALSRFENNQGWPTNHDLIEKLTAIMVALDVQEPDRRLLMTRAHEIDSLSWFVINHGDVDVDFAVLRDYEQAASAITTVTNTVIPGLVQAAGYAEAVFARGEVPAEERAARVAARMARRQVLDTVAFTALIGEPVLRSPIAPPEAMAEQLDLIAELARRPTVVIRVLPTDVALNLVDSGYSLLEYADEPAVVYTDVVFGGMLLVEPTRVAHVMRRTRKLLDESYDPDTSVRLIEQARKAL